MKKLFTLLTMLILSVGSMYSGEITTVYTAGSYLTLQQLKNLSGTGGHVAFANLGTSPWTNQWLAYPNGQTNLNLSTVQLYTITAGSVSGKYFLQRTSDSQYRTNSGWGNSDQAENIEFRAYSNSSVACNNPISIHDNSGTQWNVNANKFGGLLNAWAAYAAYGPFYIVNVEYVDENGVSIQDALTKIVSDQTTVNTAAPEIAGYRLQSGCTSISSVTVDKADVKITYTYEEKWPVNFDKNLTQSRDDRFTSYIKLGDEKISFTGQTSKPRQIYNDETVQHFTQPVGATVTPTFGYTGQAMMGYVFIDYNNDGDFNDDGELVSYWDKGANKDNRLDFNNCKTPDFTLTSTPGSYRARFKVDWANTDPGGDGSTIQANGGAVIDVMIDVKNYYEPTTNKFYRFHIDDKYMCNVPDNNVRTATAISDDASTIFYLNSDNYLIAYADGFGFNYSYCKALTPDIFNSFKFLESTTANSYFIHANPGTESNEYSNRYITINNSDKLDEGRGKWIIDSVDELPLELAANSYTSFSAPVAVTIPSNCHAYIAIKQNENFIKMKEVSGNVPANTGLIIGTDTPSNPTFDIYDGDDFADCSENMLAANVAASALSRSDNYFFGKQRSTGNYIFTKLSGDGDNYILYGHKAYLPKANLNSGTSEEVEARISIIWGDDGPTGLHELSDENIRISDGKYYQNDTVVIVRNGVKYNLVGQVIK